MVSGWKRVAASVAAAAVGSVMLIGCADEDNNSTTETSAVEAVEAAASGTETTVAVDTTVAAASADAASGTQEVLQGNNIFYTAVGAGSFLTLAKLLANADLIETIKGEGPFTVFAPTDAAFAKVPPATLEALLADKEKLKKVLLYHVVPGTVTSAQFGEGELKTAEGATLAVGGSAGSFTVNSNPIAAPDVAASNGVIHVISDVLLPPDL